MGLLLIDMTTMMLILMTTMVGMMGVIIMFNITMNMPTTMLTMIIMVSMICC